LCVIKLKKDDRLYSVAIALYGVSACLVFALALLVL